MKRRTPPTGSNMQHNGGPPAAAAVLYVGDVMHQRLKPVSHRFRYRVFSLAIDIGRLDEAGRQSRLFSVNRGNLVSFHESDHTGSRDASLATHVAELMGKAGLDGAARRIVLVCYPRIFGFVFNPLSVYYAYGDDDRLLALIYEVRNTFGERHTYVCPVSPGEQSDSGLRQSCDKRFHVSPFVGMQMRYHFRMLPPGDEIRWRILETDAEGPLLAATFSGRGQPLNTSGLAGLLLRLPFLTFKIVAGIHWEALKLWVKGVKYISRPQPPPAVSIHHDSVFVEPAE